MTEKSFSANPISMIDGGPASLVYGYIFCWFGALVTAASLAEMASMYGICRSISFTTRG